MNLTLRNLKSQLIGSIVLLGSINSINSQCLNLNCPPSITVATSSASCGAVVNYSAPIVSGTCSTVGSLTFTYTGAAQTFTVPAGVTSMTMEAWGAQGGANWVNNTNFGGYSKGVFVVTPGEVLTIYVGQQPNGITGGFNGGGNGEGAGQAGGGASDVRQGGSAYANRIIVAGGGGGAGYWSSLHVVGGVGGGLVGGDGYRDPSYAANPGGQGGTQTASGYGTCVSLNNMAMTGGFGFGGAPSGCGCEGYGGGGGWYGGAGSGNCRGGGGGSGYLLPSATNTVFTSGISVGHGSVTLNYAAAPVPSLVSGLTSGSTFSLGTTVQTYSVADSFSNTATCSFSVTVIDTIKPTVTCPSNLSQCATVASSIAPMGVSDNCGSPVVTYSLSGATSGTGSNDASGTTFNTGITNVTYIVTDGSSNSTSCSFSVNIKVTPTVVAVSNASLICAGQSATLTASGATTYTWSTSSNSTSIVVSPSVTTSYTVSGDSSGCVNSTVITQSVSACTGFETYVAANYNCSVYPNPNNGEFTIKLSSVNEKMAIEIYNVLGELIQTEKINSEITNVKLNAKNGTYLIKVTENNQLIYRTNIIKQ